MAQYRIPTASNTFHVYSESALQLYQQIEVRHFDAWSMHFAAKDTAVLYSRADKSVLALHFALKNHFDYNLKPIGNILLPQSRFNFTYAPRLEGFMKLKSDQHYWYFEVHFPHALLQELASDFAFMKNFINYVMQEKAAMLMAQHPTATTEMLHVIHSMLYNQFEGTLRDLYIETKILELILLSVHRSSEEKAYTAGVVLNAYDIERVYAARDYLLEHIDDRISIVGLSRIMGINRNKLTRGFREIYGATIFDFVLDKRMEKAKELLQGTKTPIQEIAIMVGYSKLSNFTTAFTRQFGFPPSTFRQK
jgi:AraC-like DNA-binding protein